VEIPGRTGRMVGRRPQWPTTKVEHETSQRSGSFQADLVCVLEFSSQRSRRIEQGTLLVTVLDMRRLGKMECSRSRSGLLSVAEAPFSFSQTLKLCVHDVTIIPGAEAVPYHRLTWCLGKVCLFQPISIHHQLCCGTLTHCLSHQSAVIIRSLTSVDHGEKAYSCLFSSEPTGLA
jgi:hypothetical protein